MPTERPARVAWHLDPIARRSWWSRMTRRPALYEKSWRAGLPGLRPGPWARPAASSGGSGRRPSCWTSCWRRERLDLLAEMKGPRTRHPDPRPDGRRRQERALALGAPTSASSRSTGTGCWTGSADRQAPSTILIIDDEEATATSSGAPRPGAIRDRRGQRRGGLVRPRERPDVIFLDLVMPDMTGFEVLDRLKSDEATAGHPGHHQHLGDPRRGGARRLAPGDGGDPLQVRRPARGGVRDDPGRPDPGRAEPDPSGHGVVTWPASRPTPC